MKRILHVPCYYPPHAGEIEDACYRIVNLLEGLPDVEQRVFCFGDEGGSRADLHEGVWGVRTGSLGVIAGRSVAPRYFDGLRALVRRFRPHFVHFHAPNPLAGACLVTALPARVKLIVHWHHDILDRPGLYRFIKPLETALLRRADVVVVSSERYLDGSRALKPFRGKCVVIPPLVDVERLVPSQTRLDQIRWRYGDKPLLLFVGRHVAHEGLGHLMAAVGLVEHDCCVVVGGQGPLTERLAGEHASEKVHFTGHIPPDDLAAWYTAADLFLLPTVSRHEAFGMALAEAMWCETPAVTFTVPGSGINWLNLNGVTGIEVDNGNEKQLAAAIDHLLAHDEMRREYGRAARRRVAENMTPERVAPALEELYV